MAASLEGCGVREGRVTTYIAALQSLAQKYDKVYSMYIMSCDGSHHIPLLSRLSDH